MAGQQGLGPRAIKEIAELWRADGVRLRWRDDGFDWWPGDFKVSVSALRRLEKYGPETWRLSVRTDFLREIPINDPTFVKLTALTSRFAPTYGWVYPPAEVWEQHGPAGTLPRLWFSNTAYVTSENIDWLPWFLGSMSIVQPINAQMQSKEAPKYLSGGTPDVSRPQELAKIELDGILELVDQLYAPLGREPNRWIGTDEFSAIAATSGASDYCYGNGDQRGLTLEASFGDSISVIRLGTDHSHLQLGNGLLATLQVPLVADLQTIATECAGLNLIETAWTDTPQFGCWHPHSYGEDQEGAAFSMFVPNALYQPGIASQVAIWMLHRARRLRQARMPDLPDQPLHEILSARPAKQ